jgi:hypothetical protein
MYKVRDGYLQGRTSSRSATLRGSDSASAQHGHSREKRVQAKIATEGGSALGETKNNENIILLCRRVNLP